jgi:dolichol-phosphate mannosyltransferase
MIQASASLRNPLRNPLDTSTQQMRDELTIIVPVFNEQECLPAFFQELDSFVATAPVVTRALFINDGSNDNSLRILTEKCRERQTFCSVLTLDGNYGLSTAIKAGIDHCTTSLIGYIDADLQTRPADFLAYLGFFPDYDMVNGIRQKRQDDLIKKLSSKFANAYRRLMINDSILDTCCPLKIIKISFARQMPFFIGMHRFIPALVQLQGGRVKQLAVNHYPRHAGTSKYHLWNRLIGPFFDTLAFRWIRSRYIRYGLTNENS